LHRQELRAECEELKDIRGHWAEWRVGWEQKLRENEANYLRNVAELQAAFQHRQNVMDTSYREAARAQHRDFETVLEKGTNEIWANLERMRLEYERLIHSELRLVRQRMAITEAGPVPEGPAARAAAFAAGPITRTR
jgi:hypothetical protein